MSYFFKAISHKIPRILQKKIWFNKIIIFISLDSIHLLGFF